MFEKFAQAYPADAEAVFSVNSERLASAIATHFGVEVPSEIKMLWKQFGGGYFGNGVLYFFGEASDEPRDALVPWNKKDFWRSIFPEPRQGGPCFFCETCFGDQVGFRFDGSNIIYILFLVDTFESFVVATSASELFDNVLADKYSLISEERLESVRARLGAAPPGLHYSPIVSPLLGGSAKADNFCIETPNVHFRSAVHIFHTKKMPRFE